MNNTEAITETARDFLETEPFFVSALSNISALIMESITDINWAGFYLMRSGKLTLGPFQGKPACIHIGIGKGVCGTCAVKDKTIVVPDVHQFPGHIACDAGSRSEIVIPIHKDGKIVALLDVDSPVESRFTRAEQNTLEELAGVIEEYVEW